MASYYGEFGGVFLPNTNTQIGTLGKWRMDEKTLPIPKNEFGMKAKKLVGWTASAKIYKLNRNIFGKTAEFRFRGKFNHWRCLGKLTQPAKIGIAVKEIITMDGDTPPKLFWR